MKAMFITDYRTKGGGDILLADRRGRRFIAHRWSGEGEDVVFSADGWVD